MKSSSALWQRLSTSLGSNGFRLRNHLVGDWTSGFFRGAIRLSTNARPPSPPKYTTSSRNCGAPPTLLASVLLLQLFSNPLTAFKKKDTSTCLLWMSLWPHISTAIGWKARASHLSKPCRATSALTGGAYSAAGQAASALHSMAVLQVFQTKKVVNEEAGLNSASLRDLRSVTDLALRPTKATAQAIGRSMSSLIVFERHLWLTITEMKEADKVPFLDALVSSGSLFGPAV